MAQYGFSDFITCRGCLINVSYMIYEYTYFPDHFLFLIIFTDTSNLRHLHVLAGGQILMSIVAVMRCLLPRLGGAFDLRLAVSVPLPIVMGIFVLLWFQSRLT